MIPILQGTRTIYVDTLEAAAVLARLTSSRLVWRTYPGAGRSGASQSRDGHETLRSAGRRWILRRLTMTDITAEDVRQALRRMADSEWCEAIAAHSATDDDILDCLYALVWQAARERATCAAEARAEGER